MSKKFTLSQDQNQFLQTFIIGKKKGERKKISSAYTDYCRRESKVLESLAVLEPGSSARREIQQELGSAGALAQNGNFKAAYKLLDAVKKKARLGAKGEKKEALRLNTGEIMLAVTELENTLDSLWQMGSDVMKEAKSLSRPQDNKVITSGGGRARLDEMARLRLLGETLTDTASSVEGEIEAASLPDEIARIRRLIEQVERAGSEAQRKHIGSVRDEFEATLKRNLLGGTDIWAVDLSAMVRQAILDLEEGLAENEVLAMNLVISKVGEGAPGLKEVGFEALKQRENERLDRVRKEIRKAYEQDARLSGPDPVNPLDEPTVPKPTELRTFHISDLDLSLDDGMDEEAIEASALQGAAQLKRLIDDEVKRSPNSDVLFDLLLKSRDDLVRMLASDMGLSTDRDDWTEEQALIVDRHAQALHAQLLESAPNKLSSDGKTLTIKGETYQRESKLGEGSFGDVFRFVDGKGNCKVIKTLKKPQMRHDMVQEVTMHRRAMGGENGQPHPNIVPLTGVALGPDGNPMMVMDEAEGGDGNQMARSMLAAQHSGALPKQARDALTRQMFLQMVRGMKRVHDSNMTHNDIKGANFLVTGEGTIQVADFGSGRVTDEEGFLEVEESDQGRRAREKALKEVTDQVHEIADQIGRLSDELEQALKEADGDDGDDGDERVKTLTEQIETLSTRWQDLMAQQLDLREPGPQAFKRLGNKQQHRRLKGGKVETTVVFGGGEGGQAGKHSKKYDVYMLGAMLDVLNNDFYDTQVTVDGTMQGYSWISRDTGHELTALDRLRNKMLAQDPNERPSLDSILGSAYLEMSDFSGGEDDEDGMRNIERLQAAVGAYSKAAGKLVGPLQQAVADSIYRIGALHKNLARTQAGLLDAEKKLQETEQLAKTTQERVLGLIRSIDEAEKQNDDDFDIEAAEEQLRTIELELQQRLSDVEKAKSKLEGLRQDTQRQAKAAVLAEKLEHAKQVNLRKQIDAIHQRPEIAPLLEEITKASAPFGGKDVPEEVDA